MQLFLKIKAILLGRCGTAGQHLIVNTMVVSSNTTCGYEICQDKMNV